MHGDTDLTFQDKIRAIRRDGQPAAGYVTSRHWLRLDAENTLTAFVTSEMKALSERCPPTRDVR